MGFSLNYAFVKQSVIRSLVIKIRLSRLFRFCRGLAPCKIASASRAKMNRNKLKRLHCRNNKHEDFYDLRWYRHRKRKKHSVLFEADRHVLKPAQRSR